VNSDHLGFGLYSRRIVTPEGEIEGVVVIKEGRISDIIAPELAHPDCQVEDLSDCVLLPGLIDSHVHVNEPGRTEWEGFETATKAAAVGGITTIADMPLNCDPVTTSLKALRTKLPETVDKMWVDCAFYGGVVPGNSAEIQPMIDAGVAGFKCFLVHSGIDEFPNVTEKDLHEAMPILARNKVPLLVHAELECGDHPPDWSDPRSYQSFLASRPRQWENEAIEMMIRLCRQYACPVHIVHLSSSDALPSISIAKKDGLPFTVESCPHYLTFFSEEIPDGDPRYKCAPPIRENENREKLWRGLRAGLIDFVVSDHSPCTPNLKHLESGDLQKAWGGISSLQFGLPAVWTQAREHGVDLGQVVQWMCEKPAAFLGLGHTKGKIAPGYEADLVAFSPDKTFQINESIIQHKNKVTPYQGRTLKGVVEKTYVRGRTVYEQGKLTITAGGEQLLQKRSTGSQEKPQVQGKA
jgi:allantoinase